MSAEREADQTMETEIALGTPEGSAETPPSPEQLAERIEARVAAFDAGMIDAAKAAEQHNVQGPEADQLIADYHNRAQQLQHMMRQVGNFTKAGLLGGAIAAGSTAAIANETETHDPQQQSAVHTEVAEVLAPPMAVHSFPLEESTLDKDAETPPAIEVPQHPEAAGEGVSPEEKPQTPEERKHTKDRAVLHDGVSTAVEVLINPDPSEKVREFVSQHGAFVAERVIPGAGIKRALTGTDEYGEQLSGWQRTKELGEGIIEIASFGKSKILKQLGMWLKIKNAGEELGKRHDVSNATKLAGKIAKVAPGGQVIGNIAEAVSIATDPTVQAVAKPIAEIITKEGDATRSTEKQEK